jgi:hypothetical protein
VSGSVVVQKRDYEGDVTGLPVIPFNEKHEFDTDAQTDSYMDQVKVWLSELPMPNNFVHPFPRLKVPATEEKLLSILDVMHGPDDLWWTREPNFDTELDVPEWLNGQEHLEHINDPDTQ